MTFSHEDANARLLDLVYGEAAPAEREALQAHVATCARCQEELTALGDTRARLRVALDDQPPPASAHARILAAAAAAAEASNGAQAGAAATAPPAKGNEPASRAPRTEDQPSFWDWLRGKWTLPTLATVGAVAVMLLGAKVFFEPEKTLERGRQGIFPKEEAQTAAATDKDMAAKATPKPVAPVAANMPDEPAPAAEPPADKERELSPQARARIQAVRRYNMPRTTVDGLMGSQPFSRADKLGGAPASQAIGRLRPDSFGSSGGARGAGAGNAAATPPSPVEKKPAKGSLDDLLEGSVNSGPRYAPPPSGWKSSRPAAPAAAAPPPPPAPKSALAKKRAVADDPLDGDIGGGSSSAHARAAPERDEAPSNIVEAEEAAPRRKSAPAPAPAEARSAPVAPAAAPVARSEAGKAAAPFADAKKEKDAPPSYEALAKRADELYAAQRWPEAIAVYNDLLRRFPTAEPAPRWRSRLGIAQREAAPSSSARAAKAKAAPAAAPAATKKTTSSDALEGL